MFTWLVKSGIKAAEVANTVGKVVKVAAVASDLAKLADTIDADPSKEKKLDDSSESGVSTSIEAPSSEVNLKANANSTHRADENGTKKKGSGRHEAWEDTSWMPEENKSNWYLLPVCILILIALAMIWVSSSGGPRSPDITGWNVDETKSSVEGEDEELTIYTRIGNKSDGPLPYPLIETTLTDRFLETISSRVLDPAEYLSSDLDPRKLVEPGNTFNAVITIKSPSEDATGFRLNVCYRLSDGQLSCAIDNFQ